MDSGDVRGDLYFYLGQFLLPLECQNRSILDTQTRLDCSNPERLDEDLVVTRVDMEVDSRFTTYSACNLCNGTDPFKHTPCEVGSYVCDCFSWQSHQACNAAQVG